ncbi:hypothetical protein F5887DRAFT_1159209 [Amanita rubescens]|nr:hypothetical protein F5887DRAFT_1159209 [Amanita rubescens]
MHQPALKNMTSRIEDASMSIYQFLIAVRQKDATRIVENGIKPACMFDGTRRKCSQNGSKGAKEEGEEAKETETAETYTGFQDGRDESA